MGREDTEQTWTLGKLLSDCEGGHAVNTELKLCHHSSDGHNSSLQINNKARNDKIEQMRRPEPTRIPEAEAS